MRCPPLCALWFTEEMHPRNRARELPRAARFFETRGGSELASSARIGWRLRILNLRIG
jgi:hypothetical protein